MTAHVNMERALMRRYQENYPGSQPEADALSTDMKIKTDRPEPRNPSAIESAPAGPASSVPPTPEREVEAGTALATVQKLDVGEGEGPAPPVRISVTHVILKAVAEALVEWPVMYSFFNGRKVVPNDEIALNVPVEVDNHVEYIVLRNPEKMTIRELAAEARDQLARIREGKGEFRARMLTLLKVPTFIRRWFGRRTDLDIEFCRRYYGNCVVTNFGSFGVDEGVFGSAMPSPMISVICIGRARPMPVEEEGTVKMKPHISLSLTFDHRPVDGGTAARFLARVRESLENPEPLFNGQ
jgi:pyruvate/2-oxoglutarate dehydrogenase complex dihydrolipoamide acyltransferase (E2) component